ncbi:MAG: hypothetical protein HYZ53_28540 [Planctomycetes bacterium]|nr:hypothetical protein [Planctomycetota bacterium]
MGRRQVRDPDRKKEPPPPRETAENLALAAAWLWAASGGALATFTWPGAYGLLGPIPPLLLGGWVFLTAPRASARRIGGGTFVLGVAGTLYALLRVL